MAPFELARDREDFALVHDYYDDEQMALAGLWLQLEAWRDAWQDLRCRPGGHMTEQFERESKRLARRVDELTGEVSR